jgi:hypothetical protein
MNFLAAHECSVAFREFRENCAVRQTLASHLWARANRGESVAS